jgi:hypothetical protein
MAELHLAEIAKLSLFLFGLAVGWWMVFRRTMAPLFAPAVPPDRRWELDPDPREAHRWLVTQCGALARERPGRGSVAKTSSAAPLRCPERSASISAGSSTTAPRAILIR